MEEILSQEETQKFSECLILLRAKLHGLVTNQLASVEGEVCKNDFLAKQPHAQLDLGPDTDAGQPPSLWAPVDTVEYQQAQGGGVDRARDDEVDPQPSEHRAEGTRVVVDDRDALCLLHLRALLEGAESLLGGDDQVPLHPQIDLGEVARAFHDPDGEFAEQASNVAQFAVVEEQYFGIGVLRIHFTLVLRKKARRKSSPRLIGSAKQAPI